MRDRRFALDPITKFTRNSSAITLALAGPAVALVTFASGTVASARTAAAAAGPVVAVAGPQATLSTGSRAPGAIAGALNMPPAARAHAAAHARRKTARSMLRRYGWVRRQFTYLDWLWNRESGWSPHAYNSASGAYGIPQAVPGKKMASAGPGWRTDPATQIRWGLGYIKQRYGSPRRAWRHEVAYGWY